QYDPVLLEANLVHLEQFRELPIRAVKALGEVPAGGLQSDERSTADDGEASVVPSLDFGDKILSLALDGEVQRCGARLPVDPPNEPDAAESMLKLQGDVLEAGEPARGVSLPSHHHFLQVVIDLRFGEREGFGAPQGVLLHAVQQIGRAG